MTRVVNSAPHASSDPARNDASVGDGVLREENLDELCENIASSRHPLHGTQANPFSVIHEADDDSFSAVPELEDSVEQIRQSCRDVLGNPAELRKFRPRLALLTLGNFFVILLLLTACEFAFLVYGATLHQVTALGIGELVLYTLVGIGVMIDLHHHRKQSRVSPTGDRLLFLADEVAKLEALRVRTLVEVKQLTQESATLAHHEQSARYDLSKLEVVLANHRESIDLLESEEAMHHETIAKQKEEIADHQAAALLARERLEQLRADIQSLTKARDESERMKAAAHDELVRIQAELDLNHERQQEISLRLGGLSEKITVASEQLLQQQSELEQNLDKLAQSRATIDEKDELQREIDSQMQMLQSLQAAEQELTAKLEDAEAHQKLEEMEARRDELRVSIVAAQQELASLDDQHQEITRVVAELTEHAKQLSGENEQLKQNHVESRQSLATIIAHHDELTSLVAALRAESETLSRDNLMSRQAVEEAEQKRRDIENEVTSANDSMAATERLVQQLQQRTESLNELVQVKTQQILEAKQALIAVSVELRNAEEVRRELADARAETATLQTALVELTKLSESKQAEIVSLEETLVAHKASLDAAGEELASKRRQLSELETLCAEQIDAIEKLKLDEIAILERCETERREHDLENARFTASIDKLRDDRDAASSEWERVKRDLQEDQASAEQELKLIQAQVMREQLELDSLCATIDSKQQTLESLMIMRDTRQAEIDRCCGELDKLESQVSDLLHQQTKLQSNIDGLESRIATLSDDETRRRLELKKAEELIRAAADRAETLIRQAEDKSDELSELNHRVAAAKTDLAKLESACAHSRQTVREAEQMAAEVLRHQAHLEQLQSQERQLTESSASQLESVKSRTAELNRLAQKIQELQTTVATNSSTLREEQLSLARIFEQQEQEEQRLKTLRDELTSIVQSRAQAERLLTELKNQQTDAESKLQKREAEIAEAQQISKQWEIYLASLQSETKLIAQKKQELESSIQETLAMKQRSQDDLKNAESNLRRAQDDLHQLESKIATARDRASSISSEIHQLTLHRDRCGKELDAKERRLQETSLQLDHVEMTLQGQREASAIESKRMRELEISRETLLRDLAAMESKRDAARSQWEESDARVRESTAEMDQLQKRLMAVQNELKDAENVRQDVQKLRIEKVEIERDASALRYKIEEANSIYERLTKEVDEESSKLRAITADAMTVATQLTSDEQVVRELESRKLQLENHCQALEQSLSDQEHRYERAKGALNETEAELKHTEKQVVALRSQLAALEQSRLAGESQEDELADSLRSANAQLAEVLKRLGDGETRLSELGEASEAQAREFEERRSQLAGIQTTIAAVEAQKASVQTELVEYDRLRLLAIDNLKQLQNQLHLGVEHERQLQRQFEAIAANHEALHKQLRQGQEAKDNLMRELEAESRVLAKLRTEQTETLDRIARTGAVARPDANEFPVATEPVPHRSPVAAVSSSPEKPVAEAAGSEKNRTRDVEVTEEDAWGRMLDELSATTAAAKRAVRADATSDERKNVA